MLEAAPDGVLEPMARLAVLEKPLHAEGKAGSGFITNYLRRCDRFWRFDQSNVLGGFIRRPPLALEDSLEARKSRVRVRTHSLLARTIPVSPPPRA